MRILAPAKLNLFLHVTGRRPDGYHLLQSLMAFTDIADKIEVSESDRLRFSLNGEVPSSLETIERDNIILKAVKVVADEVGKEPNISVSLTKNIPVGAGLGGGSADAAAILRLLQRYWGLNLPNDKWYEMALALGADVPFCYHGQAAFIEGIGEKISNIDDMPLCWAVLVNPNKSLSTPAVFKAFASNADFSQKVVMPKIADLNLLIELLQQTHNDLEAPAIALVPEIELILTVLNQQEGAFLSRMSGSGATCFALFRHESSAIKAESIIKKGFPHWWVRKTLVKNFGYK